MLFDKLIPPILISFASFSEKLQEEKNVINKNEDSQLKQS